MRSNREYDYFGNVLEYEYDYFATYSSTSTQKVLVLEYEYDYTSTITPSLQPIQHGYHCQEGVFHPYMGKCGCIFNSVIICLVPNV